MANIYHRIYIDGYFIHRNEKVWGPAPEQFNPYRFIEGSDSYQDLPPGSYRPFERGPRNCIGQVCKQTLLILSPILELYAGGT